MIMMKMVAIPSCYWSDTNADIYTINMWIESRQEATNYDRFGFQ